jgi:hypothetical protein
MSDFQDHFYKTHFDPQTDLRTACGRDIEGWWKVNKTSTDPLRTTCDSCKGTHVWHEAYKKEKRHERPAD